MAEAAGAAGTRVANASSAAASRGRLRSPLNAMGTHVSATHPHLVAHSTAVFPRDDGRAALAAHRETLRRGTFPSVTRVPDDQPAARTARCGRPHLQLRLAVLAPHRHHRTGARQHRNTRQRRRPPAPAPAPRDACPSPCRTNGRAAAAPRAGRAPRSSTGATSSASPSRNASSQSRSARSRELPPQRPHVRRPRRPRQMRQRHEVRQQPLPFGQRRARVLQHLGTELPGLPAPRPHGRVRTEQRQIGAQLEPAQIQLRRRAPGRTRRRPGPSTAPRTARAPAPATARPAAPASRVATSPDQVPP